MKSKSPLDSSLAWTHAMALVREACEFDIQHDARLGNSGHEVLLFPALDLAREVGLTLLPTHSEKSPLHQCVTLFGALERFENSLEVSRLYSVPPQDYEALEKRLKLLGEIFTEQLRALSPRRKLSA